MLYGSQDLLLLLLQFCAVSYLPNMMYLHKCLLNESVMFKVQDMEDLFQGNIYLCHVPLKCTHPGWPMYRCVMPFSLLTVLWSETVPAVLKASQLRYTGCNFWVSLLQHMIVFVEHFPVLVVCVSLLSGNCSDYLLSFEVFLMNHYKHDWVEKQQIIFKKLLCPSNLQACYFHQIKHKGNGA